MKYYVSALNLVSGGHDIICEFPSSLKALYFAEKLANTGAKEIEVVNRAKMEVTHAFNF